VGSVTNPGARARGLELVGVLLKNVGGGLR